MDKLKTKILCISLIMIALLSVSAVAAADSGDVISANQDDFDLSKETVNDVEDISDDSSPEIQEDTVIVDESSDSSDDADDVSDVPKSNSKDVLRAEGDDSTVTASFYHIKNGKWVNETNSTTVPYGERVSQTWLRNYGQDGVMDGYDYPFLYWIDQDGKQYSRIQVLYFDGTGEDYSMDFTAVYDEPIRRSNITFAFYHLTSSGWKNETRSVSVSNGSSSSNGNWLKTGNNGYANPLSLTYQGRDYTFLYWTGPVNDDHPDGIYQIGDRVYYTGDGTDFTMQFTAVYAISPSQVTINWEMQSPDGVVKQTETQTLSEEAPYTITMDDFNNKIKPYKSFNVGTGEDLKHYEFDHWEDADGNIISEDQVLAFTGMDYSVKYTAKYIVTVPTSNVTVIFIKKDENGDVISNESNVLEPGMTWTINSTAFENQISGYEEFDLNKVHYTFTHWEDEDGNEVTEDQVFNWTGEDYSKTYIAKYDGIAPAHVTVIFNNMSVEGAVSTNESNDIYQGMTWIINSTAFENQIANYRNFTYDGKFYNFTHWIDEDGNEVTEPQTFEWADHNYTVTYTAVYEEFNLSNVTLIFANMSYDGGKVSTNESNVLGPGVAWIIEQEKFNNQIANYRNIEHEGVKYDFVQWVDEEGNPVSLPKTFNWTGENQTYTYYAQYKLTKPSNVTLYWIRMSSSGENIYNDSSNIIAINDNWTITENKFNNRIDGFTDFHYDGAHYVFSHWINESGDAVTEQTFYWTGEDYNRTFTAIYDIYPDCNITVIWNMMDSDGEFSTNDSKIVVHPRNWTVKMSTFDKQMATEEFHYNGVYYIFNHWQDEEGNEVTEDQVLLWADHNYTVTYTAIYDEYPDCPVNVVWNMMSSDGEVSTDDSNVLIYNTNWTVTMDTFDAQLPEKEFNYSGYHYVFSHWEDEDNNEVTEDQILPWAEEEYTRTFTAVYDKTLILNTTVSNESASGKPGKTVDVEFTVNDKNGDPVPNGTLTVTVGEEKYTVDVIDGKATFEGIVLPDTPGDYSYEVNYSGTDYYYPSVGQLNLTVQKVDVIITLEEVINYTGAVVDIICNVTDEYGNAVNEGTATLVIDYTTKLSKRLMASVETYTTDVSGGKATFEGITLGDPGTYPSQVKYEGTDYYNTADNESDVVVLPLDTTTESDDVSGKSGEKKDITADILDQNGDPVKNGTAVLKVNGKEYTAEVVEGKATFKNVELPSESTEATIEYLGNDFYNPSNTTIKITIIPEEKQNETNNSTPDEEPEPAPVAEKVVNPAIPATGNPIALMVLALLSLVPAVSLGRKK